MPSLPRRATTGYDFGFLFFFWKAKISLVNVLTVCLGNDDLSLPKGMFITSAGALNKTQHAPQTHVQLFVKPSVPSHAAQK